MTGPATDVPGSPTALTAAVLAVGDELLLGDVVNTNAAWLGSALRDVGVRVVHSAVVGDDVDRIRLALDRALVDADVVLTSGGLGPTRDDVTRDAVAAHAGLALVRDPVLEQSLRDRFASYGLPVVDEVLRQADVPAGAAVLANPVGSAPGLRVTVGEQVVYALPGPPHELHAVVAPVLAELADRAPTRLVTRSLQCVGMGESSVAERVQAAIDLPEDVALSYLASGGIVRVRFTGTTPEVLQHLVEQSARALGDVVYGYDGVTLPRAVADLLDARDERMATAESLTGGQLAASLTALPGASSRFRGGIVAYATDLKASLAGVDAELLEEHGAVSAETALALAGAARDLCGADWGLSTTGVAGPDPQEGKPVGTVFVAVAGPEGSEVRQLALPGDRARVQALAVTMALDLLRRQLSPGGGTVGDR